jgi:hypothetical protein
MIRKKDDRANSEKINMFYYSVDVYTSRHRKEHSYTSVASAAAAAALLQDELHDAPENCQKGNITGCANTETFLLLV